MKTMQRRFSALPVHISYDLNHQLDIFRLIIFTEDFETKAHSPAKRLFYVTRRTRKNR